MLGGLLGLWCIRAYLVGRKKDVEWQRLVARTIWVRPLTPASRDVHTLPSGQAVELTVREKSEKGMN